MGNTYSVPSRLIGTTVLVRVRARNAGGLCRHHAHVYGCHVWWANSSTASIITISSGRLLAQARSVLRAYRYRDELFSDHALPPSLRLLTEGVACARADHDYVRVLHTGGQYGGVGGRNGTQLAAGSGQASQQAAAVREARGDSLAATNSHIQAPTLDLLSV